MFNATRVERTAAAHDAVDGIAFCEQELGQEAAVLSRDSGNQCCFHKKLNRIQEVFLDFVEDDDAEGHDGEHETEAVGKPSPADELSGAEEAVFEGFQNGGDGVEAHQGMERNAGDVLALRLAERVNDRGGVHPELHNEGEENLQIAVLGGHRRDDGAKTEGQARQHYDQQRQQQRIRCEMRAARRGENRVNPIHDGKEAELDTQAQQVADDVGERHHEPGKIDLAENAGILDERVGSLRQAVGEILPHTGTGQIEQGLRYAVSGNAGDAAEHHHVHRDRKCRLQHIPQRSEDGLLILDDDVFPDQQEQQVAVAPQFLEVDGQQAFFRLYDEVPVFRVFCHV